MTKYYLVCYILAWLVCYILLTLFLFHFYQFCRQDYGAKKGLPEVSIEQQSHLKILLQVVMQNQLQKNY